MSTKAGTGRGLLWPPHKFVKDSVVCSLSLPDAQVVPWNWIKCWVSVRCMETFWSHGSALPHIISFYKMCRLRFGFCREEPCSIQIVTWLIPTIRKLPWIKPCVKWMELPASFFLVSKFGGYFTVPPEPSNKCTLLFYLPQGNVLCCLNLCELLTRTLQVFPQASLRRSHSSDLTDKVTFAYTQSQYHISFFCSTCHHYNVICLCLSFPCVL